MKNKEFVLSNAMIHTMDRHQPRADSLHIVNGLIHAVYTAYEEAQAGHKVDEINLGGRIVLPGLTDSHIHLEKYAQLLDQVDCETNSLDECLERVHERCRDTPPGNWVLGHGWNQNTWGRYGRLEELDAVSPGHPVYLTAKSLHSGWANTKALNRASLDIDSPDPEKGKLQRNPDGSLTGILFENAMRLIAREIPQPKPSELESMLHAAQEKLHTLGITAIHDFDGLSCLNALAGLEQRGQLRLRILKQIREKDFQTAVDQDMKSTYAGDWIRIGNLKLFSDGALGPRTAAMLQPYEGEPDNLGMLLFQTEDLIEIGNAAQNAGYALSIHAIGDMANRTALDALESLSKGNRDKSLPPHRIEHVQLLAGDDVPRLAFLDVVASMQPIHATSDRLMAEKYWGDRVRWSYAWNAQFTNGAQVVFGSDAPVETPDPWAGMYAALTRRSSEIDVTSWIPEECVTIENALIAYSRTPAEVTPWRDRIGIIASGYAADLIVLDKNPYEVHPEEIRTMRPSGVMSGGEWVIKDF